MPAQEGRVFQTTALPAFMLICCLIIFLQFRSRGSYEPVQIVRDPSRKLPEVMQAAGAVYLGTHASSGEHRLAQCRQEHCSASPCDVYDEVVALKINKTTGKTGARGDSVRPVTMPCLTAAPLAQLAEQLTLNQ